MKRDPLNILAADLMRRGWVEVCFGCVRLPGEGHEGTKAIAWLSVDGRSADVYPWTPERYDAKATRVRGGSPQSTAEKIAAMFSDAPKVALHVQTTLFGPRLSLVARTTP